MENLVIIEEFCNIIYDLKKDSKIYFYFRNFYEEKQLIDKKLVW